MQKKGKVLSVNSSCNSKKLSLNLIVLARKSQNNIFPQKYLDQFYDFMLL